MEKVNPAGTNRLGIESEIAPGSSTPIGKIVESTFMTAVMIKNTKCYYKNDNGNTNPHNCYWK